MNSEALAEFLRVLDPQVAAGIQSLPEEMQEVAAAKLAGRMMDGGQIGPWRTPTELTGAINPVHQIDWTAPARTSKATRDLQEARQ